MGTALNEISNDEFRVANEEWRMKSGEGKAIKITNTIKIKKESAARAERRALPI